MKLKIIAIKRTTIKFKMFSFLKDGDIRSSIRTLTNLPGVFTSHGDKIKYALLNHSTAMRQNLMDGNPIFKNIRQLEADIELRDIERITSGRLPSMAENAAAAASTRPSIFTDNDLIIDNAALAFIMTKELAFLNRTIQMISLIANRYQEEQEDLQWGRSPTCDDDDMGSEDLEHGCGDDCISSGGPLQRSHSQPTNQDCRSRSRINELSATFLAASGHLHQRFNNLCNLSGTNVILVNAMTTMDRPDNEANRQKQLQAQSMVISDIFLHFGKFDAEHRDPVVMVFSELRDASVSAWNMMSMYAFCNLFRLTEGTDFAMHYQPENAIFSKGRDYRIKPIYQEAAVMHFPSGSKIADPVQ